MRPILVCVLLLFLPVAASALDETQRAETGDRTWSEPSAWNTSTLPTDREAVFVPGYVGESRVTVPADTSARAGALYIGSEDGAVGRVSVVEGTLTLQRSKIEGIPDAGRMIIGEAGGRGEVLQVGGVVLAAKVIRIGDGNKSSGRYVLSGRGTLHAGSAIQVTTGNGSTGVLEIHGSTGAIATGAYSHGTGTSTLKIVADAHGVTPITAHTKVTLNGTLDVNLNRYGNPPAEIRLIDNRSQDAIRGGFSQVRLRGADQYQVNYAGGDGNDVVLTRIPEDVTAITSWVSHYLPDSSLSRQDFQSDTDGDGVSNLAEYKLGTLPDLSLIHI